MHYTCVHLTAHLHSTTLSIENQLAKKAVSNSQGLVDFVIGQVKVFWRIEIIEELWSILLIKNIFWVVEMLTFGLVHATVGDKIVEPLFLNGVT